MKKISTRLFALFFLCILFAGFHVQAEVIHVIYSSDSHYGVKCDFRGNKAVSGFRVNQAMLERMNRLPELSLPVGAGVGAGTRIGSVEMVINTGDITNRMQSGIQRAAKSWREFERDWFGTLNLKRTDGQKAPVYVVPGNHDVSNAIGHYAIQKKDATAMAGMYNRMIRPGELRTAANYNHQTDKIHFSVMTHGIRFLFVHMWPDSNERSWITNELANGEQTPVLMFVHDEPNVVARHFMNPNPPYDINSTDRFENLLADTSNVNYFKGEEKVAHRALADFFRNMPMIKGYFHGHYNFSEFYDFKDEYGNPVIPCFRVDSPTTGARSRKDESLLSFMLISIDTEKQLLTARECLWNIPGEDIVFGDSRTIHIAL
ncbi:MAG: metallophosphoesterase [Bacteroidales bacterium]